SSSVDRRSSALIRSSRRARRPDRASTVSSQPKKAPARALRIQGRAASSSGDMVGLFLADGGKSGIVTTSRARPEYRRRPANANQTDPTIMAHTLPTLGYALDALEPHIDAKTMEIHHG